MTIAAPGHEDTDKQQTQQQDNKDHVVNSKLHTIQNMILQFTQCKITRESGFRISHNGNGQMWSATPGSRYMQLRN